MKTSRWIHLLLLAVLMGNAAPAHSQDDSLEFKIKSAFLFNFARFVTWPADKYPSANSPITLCVLMPDPLGRSLDEATIGKVVDGRAIELKRSSNVDAMQGCHIVFVSERDALQQGAALTALEGRGVMTVYESDVTLSKGVARFFLDQRKVRIEINRVAAQRESLQISAKLLSVSTVVNVN